MTYNPASAVSPIVQALENLENARPCPLCAESATPGLVDTSRNQMGPGNTGKHRRGRWKGLYRNSMPICQLCKGTLVVYLNRICECGWPAVLFHKDRKVWFCGSIACAERAAWRQGLHATAAHAQQWSGL